MRLRIDDGSGWKAARATRGPARRGGSPAPREPAGVPPEFLARGVTVAVVEEATPRPRRGAAPSALELEVDCDPGTQAMLLARHASGALTFHAAQATTPARRGAKQTGPRMRFRVDAVDPSPAQRGVLDRAIKLVVLRITDAVIDQVVSAGVRAASRRAEAAWWRRRKLSEGWCAVQTARGAPVLRHLERVEPGERALLFLHGTFSHTLGSYGRFLTAAMSKALRERYRGRLFAFEHFTVSRSLEENGRMLLQALPEEGADFDVVSYSRGGLLLRALAEEPERFGELGRRFRLKQGVLLAVPNAGTPLATGERWEDTLGLVANLLEALPDNPWTIAADLVADGIVWLASRATIDLPGLAAMDADGDTIAGLQQGDGPPNGHYSAIGANYHPDAALWRRLLDVGVDAFFAGANDLVVPTDGAWLIDPKATQGSSLPSGRIGCFGFDGNIQPSLGAVHHLNVVAQPETARFVTRALGGEPQGLTALDLERPRRSRKPWRGLEPSLPARPREARAPATVQTPARTVMHVEPAVLPQLAGPEREEQTLHLIVLAAPSQDGAVAKKSQARRPPASAQILGIYGNARVVEEFGLRNREPAGNGSRGGSSSSTRGSSFKQIIDLHEQIQMCLEGRAGKDGQVPRLPGDDQLREFGALLFESLFVGRIRRLYDLARSEQRGRMLNLIFTCDIPWVASKPWEFAYDPVRCKFLATEEIHFVRNVFTSVPAARAVDGRPRLRLLVVQAQPSGTEQLALEDEEARIRYQFRALIEAGLIEIDLLSLATPEKLHERVFASWLEHKPYDIVHFMGHGDFDREADQGRLLFLSGDGGAQTVDVQTLREILCGRGVQLVFLNACDTGRDSRQGLNRGVAQALMEAGLPAVVANQYKVLDPSAVCFAQHLYWALAQGASIGEAARESRIAVNYSVDGELIDWAVPVVYVRDPEYRICERAERVEPMTKESRVISPRARRRGPGATAETVGLADLARYFPGLSSIVAHLDEVQTRFAFREVQVAVPLGVWERDEKGESCLHAERFAARMRDKVRALGVDYLACLTQWWMRNDRDWKIKAWWSGRKDLPVLVFSTAGLVLPAQGPEGGRIVANAVAMGLAAQFLAAATGKSALHARKPADCPLHHNPHDRSGNLEQRLRFDARCRERLLEISSESTVVALDALLGAYDTQLGV